MNVLAVPLGLMLGLGLWTLAGLVSPLGRPRLGARVARYLVDVSPQARADLLRTPAEPASVFVAFGSPTALRVRALIARMFGGDDAVARRLRQAGWVVAVETFRSRQLVSAVGGCAAGIATAAIAAHVAVPSPVLLAAMVAFGTALGLIAPEQVVARAAAARQRRIATELPTVLEFLALSLSAGEGVLDALRRVSRAGNGELAREFGRAVVDVNAGVPLPEALTRTADAIGLPALTRTIDQLVGALERGTPLVEVFRAQALESRDDAKRQLIEAAGRKEVAMLVPLVFLILPVTIAFAIFPGLLVLQLGL
ncbi:MAG: type II secretion system F family protein [Pseudolysinimonas sp.]